MLIVSACLAGINSRYDGKNKENRVIVRLVREGRAVPLCPELLGGLGVPREAAEISRGDGRDVLEGRSTVVDRCGRDLTPRYLEGAYKLLKIAQVLGCEEVILKEGSPSCGVHYIKRSDRKVAGPGVCGALLLKNHFLVKGLD